LTAYAIVENKKYIFTIEFYIYNFIYILNIRSRQLFTFVAIRFYNVLYEKIAWKSL